jgi:hypothetical protein
MSMINMKVIEAARVLQSLPPLSQAEREASRRWYASTLARFTQRRRLDLGLSVATAAELAGLELSEWFALEAGWVPEDLMVLSSVAGTLETRWTDLVSLAFWSSSAHPTRR